MVQDEELYATVMKKLQFEPSIDESDITVAIKEDGIVVLGGTVKSYIEKRLSEEAVQKIAKVKAVANELEVQLLPSYKRSDVEIAKAAIHALQWTLFVPDEHIKVTVEKGHLTLAGNVEYHYQKERAYNAVRNLYGVIAIINNIQVKPAVSPENIKRKITEEFERNARIDARHVQVEVVDGDKVILKGTVRNFDEEREATMAAWAVPGVSNVIDNLTINW